MDGQRTRQKPVLWERQRQKKMRTKLLLPPKLDIENDESISSGSKGVIIVQI